jgi:hypothetical protein
MGNRAVIRATLAPHCVWCSAGVAAAECPEDDTRSIPNLILLRESLYTLSTVSMVWFTGASGRQPSLGSTHFPVLFNAPSISFTR